MKPKLHSTLKPVLAALLFATLSATSVAYAVGENSTAREQYDKATTLYSHKQYEESKKILLELWAKNRTHDVAATLGQVENKLGHYADSAKYFSFAIGHFPPTEEVKRLEAIQVRFQDVQKRVLTYNVKVSVEGAVVSVDGVNVDPTPLSTPVFLEPGVHVVMIRKDGFKTADRKVTATAGTTDSWDVTLQAVEVTQPPAVAPPVAPTATAVVLPQPFVEPPRDSSASKPNPWILVGGGVVTVGAVVTGLVFNSKANSAYDKASALRDKAGPSGCYEASASNNACASQKTHVKDGDRDKVISGIAYGVAGAALVSTVTYWLWPRKATSASATSLSPQFVSAIGPNNAWIGVQGNY